MDFDEVLEDKLDIINITKTASGLYSFDTIYFNLSLSEWITNVHRRMVKIGWANVKIFPGKYGYDTYSYTLVSIFETIMSHKNDIFLYIGKVLLYDIYVEAVHKAWTENYIYWKNNTPYESLNYKKPSKPIDNSYNDNFATSYHTNLPDDHVEMYLDLIKTVFDILSEEILNNGIQNLNIGL